MTTNTQISDQMLQDFRKSKHFSFMDGVDPLIRAWEAFKSTHSTVTEERREGWEIVSLFNKQKQEIVTPDKNGKIRYAAFSDCTIEQALERWYSINAVKRLSDGVVFSIGDRVKYSPKARYGSFVIELIWINSINEHQCMVSNKDKSLVEEIDNNLEKTAAPIPEEPKPVLPMVPVYLTQTQIDKLIEMLGGSK